MKKWEIILLILFVIVVLGISIIYRIYLVKRTNDAIDKEIQIGLEILKDPNYEWKSDQIFQNMRNELKTAILDLRKSYGNFKPTYKNRTERKTKELLKIVKNYYFDDFAEHN